MKVHVIGSGSDGNCYLVEHDNHYIALDCGCRWIDVLKACDFSPFMIDCCLLSHAHTDHSSHCKDFAKNGIPVLSNNSTSKQLKLGRKWQEKVLIAVRDRYKIVHFSIPHEDVANSAFLIEFSDGQRMFYATDFEYIPYSLKSWHIDHFLIAVNHSEDIPEGANAREHRLRGHSSLDTVKTFLRESLTDNCKSVTACHLSQTYADPDRIYDELTEVCGENVKVSIAQKGETIYI